MIDRHSLDHGLLIRHLLPEQSPSQTKFATHDMHGYGQSRGTLLGCHTGKILHLDQLSFQPVGFFESLQRVVQSQHRAIGLRADIGQISKRDFLSDASLRTGFRPGCVYKDLPH